jgi:hypothetical protein
MQLPLAYLDATVIEEVPLELWRQVFDATAWPKSLAEKQLSFAHTDVLDALVSDSLSDDLLQAIESLHVLGTESGREAIVAAMEDRRVALQVLPKSNGEREFALRLFLAQRNDASLADVFVRAQIQIEEGGDHRRYNEFTGKEARPVTNLAQRRDALRAETLEYCRARDLGEHVEVRAFEDDGAYVFQVFRSHHTRKPLAIVRGRSARATIEYRPVHGDILRYDAATGRLRVAARAASIVDFYCRVLGRVLFDDDLFFVGDPVCSLRVLQDKGRAALQDHGVFGVGRVWMTECLWERGDRNLLHIRGPDCFRNIEELKLPLGEGQLIQAKLKCEVVGRSTRPVTVNIRAPSRIEVSQKRHERLVDQLLDSVGIRNRTDGPSEIDLWSLYPWRHPVSVWRALFGKDTDELVQVGALKPVHLNSIPSHDHAGAGNVLEANRIAGSEFYGVSQMPEIPSRSLSSTDVDALELDPERLRIHLQSRFGITGVGVHWNGHELLDLGIVKVGDVPLHLTYALRQPQPGCGAIIRARAGGSHSVLLVPTTRCENSELPTALLRGALPSRASVIREAIYACGLTNAVPAVFSAPEGTRLVVDTQRGQIWIDGVEIQGIHRGTHPFGLVEALAKSLTSPVSTRDLSHALSGARRDGDTTARQAKTAARKCIEEAMARAGRAFDEDPFPSGPTGCYRCAIPSYVV